jgi:hypothetical protein
MLWSRHLSDHDATVECVLARVGLDGVDQRDPYAVILALGWRVEPLTTHGPEEGRTLAESRVVQVRFAGSDPYITKVLAHECGHVVLIESGHGLPHCECCADQIGRAVCLGRAGLLRELRDLSPREVAELYAPVFLASEVAQRIAEVRHAMRRTGSG